MTPSDGVLEMFLVGGGVSTGDSLCWGSATDAGAESTEGDVSTGVSISWGVATDVGVDVAVPRM